MNQNNPVPKRKSSLRGPRKIIWFSLPPFLVVALVGFIYLPLFLAVVVAGLALLLVLLPLFGASAETKAPAAISTGLSELENVVLNLDDALLVYDADFNVTFFNPAAERVFRLNKELVLGHQLQPQDIEKPAWRILAQTVFTSLAPSVVLRSKAEEYPQVADLSFTDPPLELRVTTSLCQGAAGHPSAFIKVIRDRTHEVSLLRSKTEFLTVASHQLRSPVTDINWALQALAGESGLSESGKTVLQSATAAGVELAKVIEDLLDISRIEEGHFGYKFEPMNIVDFINRILTQVAAAARRASIKIYLEPVKEALPPVMIDPAKLSMALNNLLGNAVRYNVENGEVVVKVEKQPSAPFLEVSVRDTGIGIPAEDIKKLFQKFFRSENALKSQAEGSGLGLYITKNIIQAHGGQVWAESELNRGSIFHFTLPTDPSLIPQHEVVVEE